MNYKITPEFEKDLKRLSKKFPTLGEDLEIVKKNAIELFHEQGLDNQSVFRVPGINSQNGTIYKIKKFACRALKGRGNQSGIRVIYAYTADEKTVTFLEMYFKADQKDMDVDRVK